MGTVDNWDEEMSSLLPQYVSGRLTPLQDAQVESWLEQHPQALGELEAMRRLHAALHSRPRQIPPRDLWNRVQRQIELEPARRVRRTASMLVGVILSLVTLLLLWLTIRPGVMLQWSVIEDSQAVYRVYRAPAGSQDFILLGEVTSRPGVRQYSYLDTLFLPGRRYIYQVEGFPINGNPSVSQQIASQPWQALPGQAAILVASLLLGYLAASLVRIWSIREPGELHPV